MRITPLAMASLPLAAFAANGAETTLARPDIILFMVDDMGWQDTSVPFGPDTTRYNRMFETPNMERLARSGIRMQYQFADTMQPYHRSQQCKASRYKLDIAAGHFHRY